MIYKNNSQLVDNILTDGWYVKYENNRRRDIFITEDLEKQLNKLIELSFSHYKSLCETNDELYRILFKRDAVQMIYNMIQYYVHCHNYIEALRILELYQKCFKFDKYESCGCNN